MQGSQQARVQAGYRKSRSETFSRRAICQIILSSGEQREEEHAGRQFLQSQPGIIM